MKSLLLNLVLLLSLSTSYNSAFANPHFTDTDQDALVRSLEIERSNSFWRYLMNTRKGNRFNDYLPLTGGTLTGALTGTSATFTDNIISSNANSVTFVQLLNSSVGGKIWTLISAGAGNVHGETAGDFYLRNSSDNITAFRVSPSGALAGKSATFTDILSVNKPGSPKGFNLAAFDTYANMRVISNAETSGVNADGMWIGYNNGNSGVTRLFGGGSTSQSIILNGTTVSLLHPLTGTTATFTGNIETSNGLGNYVRLGGTGTSASYLKAFETHFTAGNTYSGGSLGLVAGNAERVTIASNGSATFTGQISAMTGSDGGFQSSTYSVGHNNIWRFGNATEYGIAYYQGSGYPWGTDAIGFHFGDRNSPKFYVQNNGNATFAGSVGISVNNIDPESKLTVGGKIHSREVKVTVSAGADFVFQKDYNLKPLAEVAEYISENKHLPEIASADEMKRNGLELGEMNIKLLQKIEELTLYMIEINKTVGTLKQKNEALEKEVAELQVKK